MQQHLPVDVKRQSGGIDAPASGELGDSETCGIQRSSGSVLGRANRKYPVTFPPERKCIGK
jgi:hypothetical protein